MPTSASGTPPPQTGEEGWSEGPGPRTLPPAAGFEGSRFEKGKGVQGLRGFEGIRVYKGSNVQGLRIEMFEV